MTTAVEPMTAAEAAAYGPQWGSYMNSYDPGYIMYTAIPPEEPEHRDTMVEWLREHCLPLARADAAKGWPERSEDEDEDEDEPERVERMIAYLEALTYPEDGAARVGLLETPIEELRTIAGNALLNAAGRMAEAGEHDYAKGLRTEADRLFRLAGRG